MNSKGKRILVPLITSLVLVSSPWLLAACEDAPQTSDQKVQTQVQNQQDIYDKAQPVPIFNWSEPRNDLIQIYKAVAEAHDTWTVFYANNGVPLYVCPSKGFPIPVTDQLTNPSYISRQDLGGGNYANEVLPQPEPTGLWTGTTQGTWVLCVQADGSVEPIYSEPNVMAFSHPVRLQNGQVADVPNAASSVKITIGPPK